MSSESGAKVDQFTSWTQTPAYGGFGAENRVTIPDWVPNEAKHRIVNVRSRIVTAVRAVRSGRRRMVEIPICMAATKVLTRDTSA
jgi:hypothetical protein